MPICTAVPLEKKPPTAHGHTMTYVDDAEVAEHRRPWLTGARTNVQLEWITAAVRR